MTYLCNDQLTRVRNPFGGQLWPLPKTYRVGDRADKHGARYEIKAFGVNDGYIAGMPALSKANPRCVWMVVKFRGDRYWRPLMIGDTNSFDEKLVRGKHPNPIFNRC